MLRRRVLIWLVDPLVSVASFSFRYLANDQNNFAKLVSEYSLEWLIPKPKDLGGLPIFVVFAQNILLTMVNTHYVRQLAARPFISTGEVVDPLNDAEILHSRYFIYAGLLGMLITLISNSSPSLSDAAILILKNCCCVAIIGLLIFMSGPNLRHMYKCLNKKMKEIIRLSEKNRRDFGTRESRAESTLEEVGVDLIEAMLESDDDYEILDLKIEFAGKAKSREDKHRFNQMSMKNLNRMGQIDQKKYSVGRLTVRCVKLVFLLVICFAFVGAAVFGFASVYCKNTPPPSLLLLPLLLLTCYFEWVVKTCYHGQSKNLDEHGRKMKKFEKKLELVDLDPSRFSQNNPLGRNSTTTL